MNRVFILMLFFSLISVTGSAINVSPDILFKDQKATINLSEASDTVTITYRPNSQVERVIQLTSPTAVKSFEWLPENAGVVAINTPAESTTVSVRFSGVSGSGIFIMLLAGLLLFGGATYAFRLLMYGKPVEAIDIDPTKRADT